MTLHTDNLADYTRATTREDNRVERNAEYERVCPPATDLQIPTRRFIEITDHAHRCVTLIDQVSGKTTTVEDSYAGGKEAALWIVERMVE